jgi:endonuclease/exonuclease/phosphatase family metal-dependent hydrolase
MAWSSNNSIISTLDMTAVSLKPQIRVLSYNIHKGFSLDRRLVIKNIKETIRATDAEIVFLQEVVGENKNHSRSYDDWPVQPQLEYIADTVWPHFAYGKNAVYTEGHHGNAIMSRFPFIRFENIDISNNRLERRGLLHGVIAPLTPDGKEIHLICVHLDLFERGRKRQYERIVRRIHEHVPDGTPLLIAGDFNDWRETASPILEGELGVREMYHAIHGHHARSFPAWFPFLTLDRIYARGFESLQASCFTENPWSQLSDHGALLTVLELKT